MSHVALPTIHGGEASLVGRPGFKPGGWCHAPPGGFDSHSPPPPFRRCCHAAYDARGMASMT